MALDAGGDPRSDVFNRLLKNRVILLGSDVNDDISNQPYFTVASTDAGLCAPFHDGHAGRATCRDDGHVRLQVAVIGKCCAP